MTHYMVVSPMMSTTIPILDDGTGPQEEFSCVCFVDVKNKREAKILAVKNEEMKEWVNEQRRNFANPFSGLKVMDCKCKHGKCWCDKCISEFGECEICLSELEEEIG